MQSLHGRALARAHLLVPRYLLSKADELHNVSTFLQGNVRWRAAPESPSVHQGLQLFRGVHLRGESVVAIPASRALDNAPSCNGKLGFQVPNSQGTVSKSWQKSVSLETLLSSRAYSTMSGEPNGEAEEVPVSIAFGGNVSFSFACFV